MVSTNNILKNQYIIYKEMILMIMSNLIVPELRNKKVIIMIQANYCGHCTNAKGDYYKAAKYHKRIRKKWRNILQK